jgi:hypothetical protein
LTIKDLVLISKTFQKLLSYSLLHYPQSNFRNFIEKRIDALSSKLLFLIPKILFERIYLYFMWFKFKIFYSTKGWTCLRPSLVHVTLIHVFKNEYLSGKCADVCVGGDSSWKKSNCLRTSTCEFVEVKIDKFSIQK